MKITEIPTPALLVDYHRLQRNADRMRKKMAAHKVAFRPHLKTTKSADLARAVFGLDLEKIMVSTLAEARYFLNHGFHDIIYSVGIVPSKLNEVADLLKMGADLKVILDTLTVAQEVAIAGTQMGVEFPAMIEIDCDNHRSGIAPADEELLPLSEFLSDADGISFRGLMTHAGGSYDSQSIEEIREFADRERRSVAEVAASLHGAGIPCPIVSIGSTPTATFGERFDGVTEVRAGVYLFQDLCQVNLGVCTIDDIALSVLTTVVGHNRRSQRIITDAGMLALSLDRSTASQKIDFGYGQVCDAEGRRLDGYLVLGTNQEHGILGHRDGTVDFEHFPIGSRLRILPNHACTTAAAHDRYYVIDEPSQAGHVWPRMNGWHAPAEPLN